MTSGSPDITELIGEIGDLVRQDGIIAAATAGGMVVEPETLATFYNQLSDLHEDLSEQIAQLRGLASQAHGHNAGGLLPGGQQAWQALTAAAGAGAGDGSLVGNLTAIDGLVLSHMASTMATLNAYVETDGQAVVGLGRAAAASGSAHPSQPGGASISSHAI